MFDFQIQMTCKNKIQAIISANTEVIKCAFILFETFTINEVQFLWLLALLVTPSGL